MNRRYQCRRRYRSSVGPVLSLRTVHWHLVSVTTSPAAVPCRGRRRGRAGGGSRTGHKNLPCRRLKPAARWRGPRRAGNGVPKKAFAQPAPARHRALARLGLQRHRQARRRSPGLPGRGAENHVLQSGPADRAEEGDHKEDHAVVHQGRHRGRAVGGVRRPADGFTQRIVYGRGQVIFIQRHRAPRFVRKKPVPVFRPLQVWPSQKAASAWKTASAPGRMARWLQWGGIRRR